MNLSENKPKLVNSKFLQIIIGFHVECTVCFVVVMYEKEKLKITLFLYCSLLPLIVLLDFFIRCRLSKIAQQCKNIFVTYGFWRNSPTSTVTPKWPTPFEKSVAPIKIARLKI